MPRPGTYTFADSTPINIQEPQPGVRNILSMRPAPEADPTGLSVRIDQVDDADGQRDGVSARRAGALRRSEDGS